MMFIFIFAIIDVIAGILLMLSGPELQGSSFVFWIALLVFLKGFIMLVNDKFSKGKKIPWMAIFDFIASAALFGVSGGILLPLYFVIGIIMAGKGVWQVLQSLVK
jgi:hypothetical protein